MEAAFRLRQLRFLARYADGGKSPAAGLAAEIDSDADVAAQYQVAIKRCVRVLQGGLREVVEEMEANGLAQQAAILRGLSPSASSPSLGAGLISPLGRPSASTSGAEGLSDTQLELSLQAGEGVRAEASYLRRELDFLGWEHAPDAPAMDAVAFAFVPQCSTYLSNQDATLGREGAGKSGGAGGDGGSGEAALELGERDAVVQVLTVRDGCVTGRYTYRVSLPVLRRCSGGGDGKVEEGLQDDVAEAVRGVLVEHYGQAAPSELPSVVLTQVSGLVLRGQGSGARGQGPGVRVC
jgi:hypothetical protein